MLHPFGYPDAASFWQVAHDPDGAASALCGKGCHTRLTCSTSNSFGVRRRFRANIQTQQNPQDVSQGLGVSGVAVTVGWVPQPPVIQSLTQL